MLLYSQGNTKLKVRLQTKNFSENDEVKLQLAINHMANALSSDEFKDFVLNYSYTVKVCKGIYPFKTCKRVKRYGMTYNDLDDKKNLTQHQIYEIIMSGGERLIPEKDQEADIFLSLDKSYSNGSIGYTYPSTIWQWIYNSFFKKEKYSNVARNLGHEWMHKIGFGHPSKYTSKRKHSVPYSVGYFIRDYKN